MLLLFHQEKNSCYVDGLDCARLLYAKTARSVAVTNAAATNTIHDGNSGTSGVDEDPEGAEEPGAEEGVAAEFGAVKKGV